MENLRDCPLCRMPILSSAVRCKHCAGTVAAIPFDPSGEVVLADAAANHWRGLEARGGRLWITTARVRFESHGLNFRNAPVDFPLADVASVGTRNTLLIVPNGMWIKLRSGEEHRFVVWGRARLIALIEAQRSGLDGGEIQRPG